MQSEVQIVQEEKKLPVRAIRISSGFANNEKIKNFKWLDCFVKELKNRMSSYIYKNLQQLIDDKKKFICNYNKFNNKNLYAWEVQTIFHDICGFYENRIDQLRGRTDTSLQIGYKVTYYKKRVTLKNGIIKNSGDVKDFSIRKKYNELSKIVKLLTFLDIDHFENYKKAKFYDAILLWQKSKHWERILRLARTINKRLFSSVNVIEFTTGTYRVNLKGDEFIVDDTNTEFKHWFKYKGIFYPLLINKKYHRNLTEVKTGKNKQVSVKVVNNRVDFIFTNDYEPKFKEFSKVVALDINIKHNFCTTSDRHSFEYDRKYLNEFIVEIKKLDKLGYRDLSDAQKEKLQRLVAKNEYYFKKLVSETLDYLEAQGYTDIVMEDLETKDFRASIVSSEEFKEKYTRLIRLLRLGNIKKWMLEQAEKRGIKVHTTPAAYTSQECPRCHFVDHNNRKTQEEFKCISCGHSDNADFVSPENIRNRFFSNVLKERLHTIDDYGRLTARKIGREKLKEILSSFCLLQTKVNSC
jgi:putative transposase